MGDIVKVKEGFIRMDIQIGLRSLIMAFIISIVFFCSKGFATNGSLFAGGEIDTRGQGFTYLGLDVIQPIYKNVSVSGRIIPNYLTYRFRSGDKLVRAISPGLYAVGGIKLSWDQTTLGLFGGTEWRNTSLHPDVKNADVRGDTLAALVQGEFDTYLLSRTNFNLFASFSGTDSFFYERGRIKQQITNLNFKKANTVNLGVEQFYGRNPDFRQAGGGLILEVYNIPNKISFAFRGGYKHDTTFGSGAYGGLELSVSF
jgi:hypothetical protein